MKKRNALVLASSEGIGFGCAQELCKTCDTVTLVSRNQIKLHRAVQKLKKINSRIDAIVCDLAKIDEVEDLCKKLKNKNINIVVLNSGGPAPSSFVDLSAEDLLLRTNEIVRPALSILKATIPCMRKNRWGRIVNISSVGLIKPIPHLAVSNASRALLANLMNGVAQDEARYGITLNQVLPGIIWTPRQKKLTEFDANSKKITFAECKRLKTLLVPSLKLGTVQQVGSLVAFLCSEDSGYITGQSIAIDGGLLGVTR
jgi:3-oxoacyl-[acyl-carrier protein] reductase